MTASRRRIIQLSSTLASNNCRLIAKRFEWVMRILFMIHVARCQRARSVPGLLYFAWDDYIACL
jgi:hypothetical protein